MPQLSVNADTARSVELHYEDVGSGRPVVLVHGWPLSARSWEAQVPALVGAGYRVVTYDRRGFGESSQPWDGYDYDTLADDLDALLVELNLHDVTLVGFSMGGGEVARYVARHGSERVAAAVFASAVPPFLYKSDDNPDGGLDDATIEQFETGVKGDRIAFLDGFTHDFFTAGDNTDLVSEPFRLYNRTIAEFASPQGTLACIGTFARTDFRGDLDAFDIPTLVVHGDADGVVPFEVSGKRTHQAIAHSTLVVIEGGPHGVNATHPDQFNRALLDFLNGYNTATTPRAGAVAAGVTAPTAATAVAPPVSGRHEAVTDEADQPTDHASTDSTNADRAAPTDGDRTADDTTGATAAPTDNAATEDTTSFTARPTDVAADDAASAATETGGPTPGVTAPAPAASGDTAGLAGLTWRTAEENDPANAHADLPKNKAVREGRVADPNLGDVPVDQQPHPGSL